MLKVRKHVNSIRLRAFAYVSADALTAMLDNVECAPSVGDGWRWGNDGVPEVAVGEWSPEGVVAPHWPLWLINPVNPVPPAALPTSPGEMPWPWPWIPAPSSPSSSLLMANERLNTSLTFDHAWARDRWPLDGAVDGGTLVLVARISDGLNGQILMVRQIKEDC